MCVVPSVLFLVIVHCHYVYVLTLLFHHEPASTKVLSEVWLLTIAKVYLDHKFTMHCIIITFAVRHFLRYFVVLIKLVICGAIVCVNLPNTCISWLTSCRQHLICQILSMNQNIWNSEVTIYQLPHPLVLIVLLIK